MRSRARLVIASLLVVVSSFLGTAPVSAKQSAPSPTTAVPRMVRVTGTFRPADGGAPAPVEIITFSLYAAETGGTPLWQETQYVSIDSNGQYAVLLGATRADGMPLQLFASGEAQWLDTHFMRYGEPDRPRVLLASVPYALRAADADTLGGKPLSAFLLAPSGDLNAAGGTTSTNAASTSNTPGANAIDPAMVGQVPKYVTTSDLGASAIYDSGGFVGINTMAPRDALDVRFANTNGYFVGNAVQNLGNTTASFSGTLFYDQNGTVANFHGFNNLTHEYRVNNIASSGTINLMLGGTSRLKVAANGDVGIGVNPSFKFDVAGDINSTGDLRRNGAPVFRVQTASRNTLVGLGVPNPIGLDNVTLGTNAGSLITTGEENTAIGSLSYQNGITGVQNTAIGALTLRAITTANGNIALGAFAGMAKPSGDMNMYLGYSVGNGPSNTESNTIRIGDSGLYNRSFIGGVRNVATGIPDAVMVLIDSTGQLGTINSSRRYKEDIRDMGDASSGLMKLRPVTYRYQQPYAGGSKPIDYGLIAEEVEEVYPGLVTHLADGQVETVQYHKINAMLLNEVQKQHRMLEEQRSEIELLKARLAALETQRR